MKGFIVIILLAMVACSGEDPCDRCYDADYYYENPYYCQECLEEISKVRSEENQDHEDGR
jgi:uncharacterized Zn ribbon protein